MFTIRGLKVDKCITSLLSVFDIRDEPKIQLPATATALNHFQKVTTLVMKIMTLIDHYIELYCFLKIEYAYINECDNNCEKELDKNDEKHLQKLPPSQQSCTL